MKDLFRFHQEAAELVRNTVGQYCHVTQSMRLDTDTEIGAAGRWVHFHNLRDWEPHLLDEVDHDTDLVRPAPHAAGPIA
jgi:hypothetical protein